MFKGELLREFVTERLAAATRDILAVVDRSVAGLEDEAAGLRQEIDRQKKQLEVLLQPRVSLYKAEVKSLRIQGLAEEDEETESPEDPENLEESTHQPPSRSGKCLRNPHKRRTPQSVTFRIRILKDPHTVMLSTNSPLFKKFTIQKLECPGSLNEADFLALLRSTFPQLDRDKSSLDFLVSDKTRKLRLLKLNALTPKEILKHIYNPNQGILTIRLKDHQERIPPRETEEGCTGDSPSSNEPRLRTSNPVQEMQEEEMETEEAQDEDDDDDGLGVPESAEDLVDCSVGPSEGDGGEERPEAQDSEDDWRPDSCHDSDEPDESNEKRKERESDADPAEEDEETESPEDPENLEESTHQPPSRSGKYSRNPHNRRTPQSVTFRIRILKDPHTVMLSTNSLVLKKCTIQKLECPGSLNEADFLALLRSTFPQLDRDKSSFDFLVSDKTRKLRLLKLNALTPKEILKHIYNPNQGILTIRLKDHQESIPPRETEEGCTGDSPSTNEPRLLTGSPVQAVQQEELETEEAGDYDDVDEDDGDGPGVPESAEDLVDCFAGPSEGQGGEERPQARDSEDDIESDSCHDSEDDWKPDGDQAEEEQDEEDESPEDLQHQPPSRCVTFRIRILKDPHTVVLSNDMFRKCPMQKMRCLRSLNEADFLALLRSTFPQLDRDKSSLDFLVSDKTRKLRLLKLNALTPKEILGHIRCPRWGTLCIRPQTSDEPGERPKTDESTKRKRGEAAQRYKNKRRRIKTRPTKTESGDVVFTCKVCGALHESEVALVKEAWSHVEDPGSVECGVCGERSESVETLKDHLQTQHRTYNCHICDETFLKALSFNEHVAAHSGDKPYECEVCHEAFALEVSLKDHLKVHRSKKTYQCVECGKFLFDSGSLSRHRICHTNERPFSCKICGNCFKSLIALRQHETIHTERERSHLCEVCPKMFTTNCALKAHMRQHTNERPFQCGKCGKTFNNKAFLNRHMRVHTAEKPFRCLECGRSFKHRHLLKNHMSIHSGVKPFVCKICGSAHRQKEYLDIHMRTHTGERPYKCSLCDRAFTQGHCLKTHMKSHQKQQCDTDS